MAQMIRWNDSDTPSGTIIEKLAVGTWDMTQGDALYLHNNELKTKEQMEQEKYYTVICTSPDEMKEVKRLMDEKGWESDDNSFFNKYIEYFKNDVNITFKDDWDCGDSSSFWAFTNKISFSEFMLKQNPQQEKWWLSLKEGDEVQCTKEGGEGLFWEPNKTFIIGITHFGGGDDIVYSKTNPGLGVFVDSLIPTYIKTNKNDKSYEVQRQSVKVRRGQAKTGKCLEIGRPGITIKGRYKGHVPKV